MKVKTFGVKATQAYLLSNMIETKYDIEKGMKEIGTFIKYEIKESIEGNRNEPRSVDTGEFVNSVDMVSSKDSTAIFSDVKHSKFLEFGTSRMKARRHFNNSKDRNILKIINIMKKNVR